MGAVHTLAHKDLEATIIFNEPLKTLWTGTDSQSDITTCFMMAMMQCNRITK